MTLVSKLCFNWWISNSNHDHYFGVYTIFIFVDRCGIDVDMFILATR